MRRVELHDQNLEIILTGLTMLEALQGRLVIPYAQIAAVYPRLQIPPNLWRLGGTSMGANHEGHYVGEDGWYFLSFQNPEQVITLNLANFRLGRQRYAGVAVEVDNPDSMAESIKQHLSS